MFILLIADISISQEKYIRSNNNYQKLNFDILKDSSKSSDTNITFRMRKSPWKSVLYSALLPGLGQYYNETYWKIPIVAIAGGYLGYVIIKNNNKFSDYKDSYSNSITPENPQGDLNLKSYREFYRDQRDQFILYFGLFYLINLADAYVDAHLYDFDVTEKIKLTPFQKGNLLNLNIDF